MKIYKDVDLDYGANTELMEEFDRMKREEAEAAQMDAKAQETLEQENDDVVLSDESASEETDDDIVIFSDENPEIAEISE